MDGLQLIRKQAIQDKNIDVITGEVTDARKNADLTNYNNLKERLDTMDGNLVSAINGLEWKSSVPTFDKIATTYPNPEEGWTVSVDDTNKIYRYDDVTKQWLPIISSFENATTTHPGLMSPEDKKKLDNLNALNTGSYVDKTGDVMTGNLTMSNGGKFIGDLTGNSDTSTKLKTPVNINGVAFDGTKDINITVSAGAGTLENYVKPSIGGAVNAGDTLNAAIGKLEVNLDGKADTYHIQASSTINTMRGYAISQTGGSIMTTDTLNIAIGKLEFEVKSKTSSNIMLTGYTKPGITNAIAPTDTLNVAIGKLETGLDKKSDSNHTHNYAGSAVVGGAATSALKLETPRTIKLTGDVTGTVSFDGSRDVTITTTVASGTLKRLNNDTTINQTTNTVNIGIAEYNPLKDILNVYLAGVRLRPGLDYDSTATTITGKNGVVFNNGDAVSFEVVKLI